jgi:hypothetical protein
MLAPEIGSPAVVAVDNRDALYGADAVIFALRFVVLKGVMDEIADSITDKFVVVPINPFGINPQGAFHAFCRRAILWRGCKPGGCRRGALGYGVQNPVGRSLRVL